MQTQISKPGGGLEAEALAAQLRNAYEFGWNVRQDHWTRAELQAVMRRAQPVLQAAALAGFGAGSTLDAHVKAQATLFAAGIVCPQKRPALRLIQGGKRAGVELVEPEPGDDSTSCA